MTQTKTHNFLKSRKFLTGLIIFFAIFFELISALIFYNLKGDGINNYIETLYYTTQIISSIFVISGVVIAVWQYYLTSKSTKTEIEIQQVQRAIDLSEYYKDNILKYYPAIDYIFDKTGILKILNTLKLEELNDFDCYELRDRFNDDQIKELRTIQDSDLFLQAIIEANFIYNLHLELWTRRTETETSEGLTSVISINRQSATVAFLSNLVTNVLNNMEFFALHFHHKTADESVVYQSLHQSYFKLIRLMYYYIAKGNENPSDKYYTNTIKLFIDWRSEKTQQKENRSEKSGTIPRKGTIIQKISD